VTCNLLDFNLRTNSISKSNLRYFVDELA